MTETTMNDGSSAMAPSEPQRNHAMRKARAGLLIEVGVNFVLPVLVYDRLKPAYGDVGALLASSLPPLAWSATEFLRRRRLDALSMLALTGVALSLVAFAGGGGMHMLQLREKLVTALIGVVFLGSAAVGRPLVYQLARAGEARKSAEELAALEALRDKPLFRRTIMTMTLVWGFGLVAEATLSAALVLVMPVRDYLIISPILGYGTMGGLGLWTLWFRRRRSALGRQLAGQE